MRVMVFFFIFCLAGPAYLVGKFIALGIVYPTKYKDDQIAPVFVFGTQESKESRA